METQVARFAVVLQDGRLAILGFITRGRGSSLPSGAVWSDEKGGWWEREPTPEAVADEVGRAFELGPDQRIAKRISHTDPILFDRRYRNAWKFQEGEGALALDMEKAAAIRLGQLRLERNEELKRLDVEWAIAMESGNLKTRGEVEIRKAVMRSMPELLAPILAKATNADELDAVKLEMAMTAPALEAKGRTNDANQGPRAQDGP